MGRERTHEARFEDMSWVEKQQHIIESTKEAQNLIKEKFIRDRVNNFPELAGYDLTDKNEIDRYVNSELEQRLSEAIKKDVKYLEDRITKYEAMLADITKICTTNRLKFTNKRTSISAINSILNLIHSQE